MNVRIAIPARFASTRLPGKPLLPLAGRPMIEHVYRRAVEADLGEVVIATDDERIAEAASGFGATVVMTPADLPSGTDRLAWMATSLDWPDDDIVVNLQGDEPLMPPALLSQVAGLLGDNRDADIATLCVAIDDAEGLWDPAVVKVTCDVQGRALYFSRAPIPYHRDGFVQGRGEPVGGAHWRHLGLYAYRVAVLRRFPSLSPSHQEQLESLEQLRALWHGMTIQVAVASSVPPAGVDTPADLARVEAVLAGRS